MIEQSFCIFPGIGPRTERRIWGAGILTWADFLKSVKVPGVSPGRKPALDRLVREASRAWEAGNTSYFNRLLGHSEAWRLWGALEGEALCLDIETDGRSASEGSPTVVGFYSHGEYRAYIKGISLTEGAIRRELEGARLLVSYFGSGFDIPFLRACYPRLDFGMPHFDLCPAGHRVGLRGGLKKVEKAVGITRPDEVEGLGGYEAVLLWNAHLSGAEGALDTLVCYNREDTVNLHPLAWNIYGRLMTESGLPALSRSSQPS